MYDRAVPGAWQASRPAPAARSAHPLHALQRAAGNQAVTSVVVQRSRDDHLAALRAAVRAASWQEVATRLNGFNTDDIKRLAAGLSVGEAANTRAAVATHLAGWPQETAIIAALDAGRAEVARIGRIYQAYEVAVRDADWPGAVRQLHAMSQDDIDARLRKLSPDGLRALCGAAPELSGRISKLATAAAGARGIDVSEAVGHLVIGDRDLGPVSEFHPGGESAVDVSAPLAQGGGAALGGRRLTDTPVTLAAALPRLAGQAAEEVGRASGVFRKVSALGGATGAPVAETGAGLVIRVPVVGLAFLAGVVAPYATGWAIAHAAEVAEKLGEFGGTLPPGGGLAQPEANGAPAPGAVAAPAGHPKKDEGDDCHDCPNGTTAEYGPLDSLGRATGVRATLKGRTWSGQAPAADPAGFVPGTSGTVGAQARAHLLARTLGGSGAATNLVTFGQAENVAMYHNLESVIEDHVTLFPDHCVEFAATPIYQGRILSASAIHLFARDLCTGETVVNETAANRTLH